MRKDVLQVDAEFVQLHRHDADQRTGKKAFQNVDGRRFDVGPPALILDGDIEDRHDHTGGEQRPTEQREQPERRLHPSEIEDLGAHVAHHLKKVGDRPVDDLVEPPEHGIEDRLRYLAADEPNGAADRIADPGINVT